MLDQTQRRAQDSGGDSLRMHPDARRSRLREIIVRIEASMPEDAAMQPAWHELIEALALGPEPATCSCPHCGATVMEAATRCGHCWSSLVGKQS